MGITMVTVSLLFLLLSAFSPPVHTAFYFIPGEMTWTEAQKACRENYTDLATVHSDGDNTELVTVMNNNNIRDGWIGLHRGEKSWKWSNGDAVTFMQQIGNCDIGISSVYCAVMKDASGGWDSTECTQKKPFMCYKQDALSGDPKYHLILEEKTWYEAQRYCRRNYTDLVSIRDEQQNETVKNAGSNSTTPFWIGLLCDDWQWSDGENSTYRNWEIDHAQNEKNCVKLSNRKWHAVDCNEKLPALCYHHSFIHVSDKALNWEEALDYCYEDNRAGLLKIESATEQKEVESELKRRRISEPVWVGLRQSQLFGFWLWPNGNAVHQYSNWAEGKQPEHQLSQHCGAVEPWNEYRWRDKNCLSRYRALCHIKCPA